MEERPPIAEERERVVRLARRMLAGELAAEDGAREIASVVDPAGGPAGLDAEHRDVVVDFYGWLCEVQDTGLNHDVEILGAAHAVVQRYARD